MKSTEPQTVRERVKAIRYALGSDLFTPLKGEIFAERANAVAARFGMKTNFDASMISKIENGKREVSIEEVPVFAALDPLQRGAEWLAWGAQRQAEVQAPRPVPEVRAAERKTANRRKR